MVRDAQTHSLPKPRQEIERLACLCGEPDAATFREKVTSVLKDVNAITEGFYAASFYSQKTSIEIELTKSEKEFSDLWRFLPVLQNDRANAIFSRILPEILVQLRRAAKPREALAQFDGFIRRLPAGVQLFSMFEANPKLISLLTDICATAPDLAEYLSSNAQVLEAVIYGEFFMPVPDAGPLTLGLAQTMDRFESFEQKIAASRLWAKEQHFRVGVQHLRGLTSWHEAAASYFDLAKAALAAILPIALGHAAKRHHVENAGGTALLALDSLGAGTLTAKSALNFILLYDSQPQDGLQSGSKVSAQKFHSQVTRTLVTALTSKMKEGQIYKISDRIRPSGQRGLVATSVAAFRVHQLERAETWEHLALTRAQVVAGPSKLASRIERIRREIISGETSSKRLAFDMRLLRRRFVEATVFGRRSGDWELRLGRGRLLDIEGFSQAGVLLAGSPARSIGEQLAATASTGWITDAQAKTLHSTHTLLRTVLQVARLTAKGQFDPYGIGTGAADFLLRETDKKDLAELRKCLRDSSEESGAIISHALSDNSCRSAVGGTGE